MGAAKLTEYAPPGEQGRLQNALLNMSQHGSSVSTLPVTFKRGSAGPMVVDIFIVDRRKIFADCGSQEAVHNKRGFLLGVRVSSRMGTADLVPCWENDYAVPLTHCQRRTKQSDNQSSSSSSSSSICSGVKLGCAHPPPFVPSTCY